MVYYYKLLSVDLFHNGKRHYLNDIQKQNEPVFYGFDYSKMG